MRKWVHDHLHWLTWDADVPGNVLFNSTCMCKCTMPIYTYNYLKMPLPYETDCDNNGNYITNYISPACALHMYAKDLDFYKPNYYLYTCTCIYTVYTLYTYITNTFIHAHVHVHPMLFLACNIICIHPLYTMTTSFL